MLKYLLLIVLSGSYVLFGQLKPVPDSELRKIFFISEVNGITSTDVNPAGLSIKQNDDGVLTGYDFVRTSEQGNINSSISFGNFGFSYSDFYGSADERLRIYSLNISVGGEVLSIGTSNKLISADSLMYSVDAGILFQPSEFLKFAAVIRNINETEIAGYSFTRSYVIGGGIFLLNSRIKLFAENEIFDRQRAFKNSLFHLGVGVLPISFFELRGTVYKTEGGRNNYTAGLIFEIAKSLKLQGNIHLDSRTKASKYSVLLMIPLQTVRF